MGDVRVGLLPGYVADLPALEAAVRRSVWAEEQGFSFILLGERIQWKKPMLDAFIAAALIAQRTRHIGVGPICLMPVREPLITSKLICTVDQISGGRMMLFPAIGGDYAREYRNCGVEMSERVGRTDEALEILRRLWTEAIVTYEGIHYRLRDAVAQPRPVRPGGPPMWLAHRGRSAAALRRTVRLCDGWLASWVSPDRFRRRWQEHLAYAETIGRDPSTLTPAAIVRLIVARSKEDAIRRAARWRADMYGHAEEASLMDHLLPLGTVEQCAEKLRGFLEAGVTHLVISSPLPEDEWDEQLEVIAKEVLPMAGIDLRPRLAA